MTDNTEQESDGAAEKPAQSHMERLTSTREKISAVDAGQAQLDFFSEWAPAMDTLRERKQELAKTPQDKDDAVDEERAALTREEIRLTILRKQFQSRLPEGPRRGMD